MKTFPLSPSIGKKKGKVKKTLLLTKLLESPQKSSQVKSF
jgi:hypothetical protein